MILHPAPPDSGIVFRRIDSQARGAAIPAIWRNAETSAFCTTLQNAQGVRVRTVEHLMCALYACEIDNVEVGIDGDEVPILDGSAAPFVSLIKEAGIEVQAAPRRFLRLLKAVEVREGKSRLTIRPAAGFTIDLILAMPDFGLMRWSGDASPSVVQQEIAPARTYGRLKEALPVLLAGRLGGSSLFRGASLKNAVVVHGRRVLNRGGLRMPDEFVRHRVLDIIGDLRLAGGPLLCAVEAVRTRHSFNRRLLFALFGDESAWCWTALMATPSAEPPAATRDQRHINQEIAP